MGQKGNIKVSTTSLIKAAMVIKASINKTNPEFENIQVQLRKLRDMGLEGLSGGKGDEIKKALEHTEESCARVSVASSKILKTLDLILEKSFESGNDTAQAAEAAELAKRKKEQVKLSRK